MFYASSANKTASAALAVFRAAALILALALVGCPGNKPEVTTAAPTAPIPINTKDPEWIYQDPNNKKPVAVVFVHGIFGNVKSTWQNEKAKTSFFKLVHDYPGIGDKVDIYAFGFSSKMFTSGSLDISEAAKKLDTYLSVDRVKSYENIVFVAHSMGGLVAMQELVTHPELQDRVRLMMFYGTPQEGSEITAIAEYASQNPAIGDMKMINSNDYLIGLNEQWTELKAAGKTPVVMCGYETMPTKGVLIVPWNSATKFCTRAAPGIEDSDHMTIVKPDRARHHSVITFVDAMNNYVLPRLDPTSWKVDELEEQGATWTYALTKPFDVNPVSIRNLSSLPQSYSVIKNDSNENLYFLPATDSTSVPAKSLNTLRMIPFGELKPEYIFQLKLGSLPPKTVIARFASLADARAQRAEESGRVALRANGILGTEAGRASFALLTQEERDLKLARLAKSAIDEGSAIGDESVKWLLAADTLSRMGIGNSAQIALDNAKGLDPALPQSLVAIKLEHKIKAQPSILDLKSPTNRVLVELVDYRVPDDLKYATPDTQAQWSKLAENMKRTEGFKVQGMNIEGDLLQTQGNAPKSIRIYEQAMMEDPTSSPFFQRKIKEMQGDVQIK